jgi:hypothetical protein
MLSLAFRDHAPTERAEDGGGVAGHVLTAPWLAHVCPCLF